MKLRTFAIYFFLTWGLLSSCVKEDYGNCHNYYVVNLSYMGDNIKEIFDRKICSKASLWTQCASYPQIL
jgi:hypothetical protein